MKSLSNQDVQQIARFLQYYLAFLQGAQNAYGYNARRANLMRMVGKMVNKLQRKMEDVK